MTIDIKSLPLSEVYRLLEVNKSKEIKELNPLSTLCKVTGKYGMYISLHTKWGETGATIDDFIQAAPYLKDPSNQHVLINGFGYFLSDYLDDLEYAFDITIGDSGPNLWNSYTGPATIYALTCDPNGVELDENT